MIDGDLANPVEERAVSPEATKVIMNAVFYMLLVGMCSMALVLLVRPSSSVREKWAVEAGHAEYYVDTEHKKQFRWKLCTTCEGSE